MRRFIIKANLFFVELTYFSLRDSLVAAEDPSRGQRGATPTSQAMEGAGGGMYSEGLN